MSDKLVICRNCVKELKGESYTSQFQFKGFFTIFKVPENMICPKCKSNLEETNISHEDANIIFSISKDNTFLEAMIDLKEKDIIEYELKMSQFRNQVTQQKNTESVKKQESNQPKCPKCGSTSIQIVPRKWSLLTGFATKKTDRVCVNCKHRW